MSLATYAELLDLSAGDVDAMLQHGRELLRMKRYDDAAMLFRGLVFLDAERAAAHRGHLLALCGKRQYEEALLALEPALAIATSRGDSAEQGELAAIEALAFIKLGRKAPAQRAIRRALKLGPPDAPWRTDLESGAPELARWLPEADPDEERAAAAEAAVAVRIRVAQMLSEGKSLSWALGYTNDELTRLYTRARGLLGGGRVDDAKTMFAGLVALEPSSSLFALGLAHAARLGGDLVAAGRAFDHVVAAARLQGEPRLVAGALLRRGLFRVECGDAAGGRMDLEEALKGPLAPAEVTESKAILARLGHDPSQRATTAATSRPARVKPKPR